MRGTYDGVPGTFTCQSTCTARTKTWNLCRAVAARASSPAALSNPWDFKPGSITTRVKAEDQADQDDAYLYFGVWSSIPDNIGPATAYNFRYVFGGGAETDRRLSVTNFATLVGPATFRGGAVGKYVTQGQVGGQNAKIGTFTATATLNADFTAKRQRHP